MTDRVNALIVVLEQDLRIDDAEPVIDAIRHIKGVLTVDHQIVTSGNHVATVRAKAELQRRLWEVLQ